MRFFSFILLALIFTRVVHAQADAGLEQRIADLEQRVARLEKENRRLLGARSVMHYIHDSQDGQRIAISLEDKVVANVVVGQRGWGESRTEDVAAVVESVARTVFTTIPPQDTPTIIVLRSEHGPRALSNRGPNNEYIVLLNSGDRRWAQLSYQLAHELGHVLCREVNERAPQHWFEEAFSEAMSIWTLEKMSQTWKTNPPYQTWASYADSIAQYVADIRSRVQQQKNMSAWYAKHRQVLDKEPYDRDKNRIIAAHIATQAKTRPDYLRAFLYLRTSKPSSNTIESLFQAWHSSCPNELKYVPHDQAKLLGVKIPE